MDKWMKLDKVCVMVHSTAAQTGCLRKRCVLGLLDREAINVYSSFVELNFLKILQYEISFQ